MRGHQSLCATVATLLILCLASPRALGDDLKDCRSSTPDRTISGCSAIIKKGGDKKTLAEAFANRGDAYYTTHDYDPAIADYNDSIAHQPINPRSYAGRADAYYEKGDYERAIADANQALRMDVK